jgi:PAS domain S-box-containing protein
MGTPITITDWVITSSSAITGVIVIYGAYTKGKRWIINKINMIAGTALLHERQKSIESKLDKIIYELTINGGNSTKDVIKSVRDAVVRVESRQQALLDTIDGHEGLFECNLSGEWIWVNKKLCYLLGVTKEDLLGYGFINYIKQEYRENVREEYLACIEENREFLLEFPVIRAGANELMITMKTNKMVDRKGVLIGYFGNIFQ